MVFQHSVPRAARVILRAEASRRHVFEDESAGEVRLPLAPPLLRSKMAKPEARRLSRELATLEDVAVRGQVGRRWCALDARDRCETQVAPVNAQIVAHANRRAIAR